VYPGGDTEAYRPWVDRHHIDMHGHKGFVRLALQKQVPIVPVVSHGSHETIIVLWRGEAIARLLQLTRIRVNVMPVLAGLPWGIAPVWMPMVPFPAKITLQVCEPFDWSEFGPEAADDDEIVERCYEQVLGRMQATLDELVEENPHPLLGRFLPFMRRVPRS
jgi:1-acyl-sn-glycerol-3-phosphate acyltransferase